MLIFISLFFWQLQCFHCDWPLPSRGLLVYHLQCNSLFLYGLNIYSLRGLRDLLHELLVGILVPLLLKTEGSRYLLWFLNFAAVEPRGRPRVLAIQLGASPVVGGIGRVLGVVGKWPSKEGYSCTCAHKFVSTNVENKTQ
jgi:hypothetical protein